VDQLITQTRPPTGSIRAACASPAATLLAILLVAILLACLPIAPAFGDGDPASDVLLVQNAFYPYTPRVPAALESRLNALLAAAKAEHMPLKVAIIGSREDLGAVPTFFGTPQKYAEFLDREISYNTTQPLLVVMPAGFGLTATGPAGSLAHLKVPPHAGPAGLTLAAIAAVRALVLANGHTLKSQPASASSGSANTTNGRANSKPSTVILFGLPVLLLVLAGIPIAVRNRRRSGDASHD
jgi:hypothetical protein